MKRCLAPFFIAAAAVVQPKQGLAQAAIPDSQLTRAIEAGTHYRSRQEYLDKGTKANACKVAGLFAMDGISKEIRFFSDFDIVAAASAAANSEMRRLSLDDARKLPLTGVLLANVQMVGRGMIPVQRLQSRYGARGVHLVVQPGDSVIQPLTKEAASTTQSGGTDAVLYTWYNVGNTSLLTGVPLGFQSSRFQQEFAFPISPSTLPDKFKVFLIDSDGDRKEVTCRADKLRER